jgi:hypothetical protein
MPRLLQGYYVVDPKGSKKELEINKELEMIKEFCVPEIHLSEEYSFRRHLHFSTLSSKLPRWGKLCNISFPGQALSH